LIKQETPLMLTNPRDAFRGQSRSPNIIRYVRHGFQLVFYSNFVPTTPCFSGTRLQKMSWPWNPG